MRTRIDNVTLLTCDTKQNTYYNSSITFENDTIIAINHDVEYDVRIDGKNGILIPGFVNTHAHLPMIVFRSLQDDLYDRLRLFIFPLEKACMNKELTLASAKIGALESLLCGVTTVADMYYYCDDLAQLYESLGLRSVVIQTILDKDLCDAKNEEEGFKLACDLVSKWQNHPLITPCFGPHGTTTVSEEMLIKIRDFADKNKCRVSMHVSEMDYELEYYKQRNTTPIQYLANLGILNERFISAHTITANDKDIELLKKYGVKIAHCINANMKAAKGIAPIKEYVDANIKVGLGTDGPGSGSHLDMFMQMNVAVKAHKNKNKDRSLFPSKFILQMATLGGAQVLGLDDKVGSLEVGKKADLVLIETESVNMFPVTDPYSALVYSAHANNVDSVWVNGIQKVKHKKLIEHDIQETIKETTLKMSDFNKMAQEISNTLKTSKS